MITLLNPSIDKLFSRLSILTGMLILTGCVATLNETHYVLAYDPETNTSNYFKIDFNGSTFLSRSKFSIGEYDRTAVNRLFSEAGIRREYEQTDLKFYDVTGQRIRDLSTQFQQAKTSAGAFRLQRLDYINSSIAELCGELLVRLKEKEDKNTLYLALLNEACMQRQQGESHLKTPDLTKASASFGNAIGSLNTINLLYRGADIVRHFDPDGNEVDVRNQSQLVFVATDTSAFTSAVSQLVASDQATDNLLKTVLGPRIQEQKYIEKKVQSSNTQEQALKARLESHIEIANNSDEAAIKKLIPEIARDVVGYLAPLEDAAQIETYAKTMGAE